MYGMIEYLFVSPSWENPTRSELVEFPSFKAAESYAEQLAEQLNQRVQWFEFVGDETPSNIEEVK